MSVPATEEARFDPFGNLTRLRHVVNNGVPEIRTLMTDPLSNRLTGSSVEHDAAGNLTCQETHLYRFDVFLVAFSPGAHWHYFPNVAEILITAGLVAGEIAGYMLMIRFFPILSGRRNPAPAS